MKKTILYGLILGVLLNFLTPLVTVAKSYTISQQKIISRAKSRIGCKYVYGGSGSRKFDCSGLVYWVYKTPKIKVKKRIKRTSCQQMYRSLKRYKISSKLKKARAGDIILYKNGNRYTHAAISIGNGKMIHASSSKKKVCKARANVCKNNGVAIIRVWK